MVVIGMVISRNNCFLKLIALRKNITEFQSSIFGFQEDFTLVSYCPKKNKTVLVVSSMHNDDAIDKEKYAKKLEIITFYNQT